MSAIDLYRLIINRSTGQKTNRLSQPNFRNNKSTTQQKARSPILKGTNAIAPFFLSIHEPLTLVYSGV
ncbi:hypothetical protein [Leptolyngbya ohadii]|uniref:hypothetical protein n=1 Tax=Leptolyngbya ohadii TaxID=1962290 RepID=UPI00117A270C|nr:hypothetical protein [Leptolyngbya ohadii]